MVKIGRFIPYSEPGNPFPDETDSFAAMPPKSPMHILPYGLLSDMILPLIKMKRREKREQRKEFLIKKTLNVNLKTCFGELRRLSKLYPWKALIPSLRSYHMNSKKNMMKLVDNYDIPLIYLEDMYQKQLQGPPKLEIGDWVECKGQYGVVTCIGIGRSEVFVKLVKHHLVAGKHLPTFHRWERDYSGNPLSKQMSRWECKKIGHDTPEWVKLRKKMIEDWNKNLTTRASIWNDKLVPAITEAVLASAAAGSGRDIILERYKDVWMKMHVNVLNKRVWESMSEAWSEVRRTRSGCYLKDLYYPRTILWHSEDHIMNLRSIILGYDILD